MKGLIVSSGNIDDYSLLYRLTNEYDYILCADGGLNHLMKISKTPDLVLGDLDSVSKSALKYIRDKKIKVIRYPVLKDKTDTELAICHMLKINCKEVALIGVTGSRLDHSIANLLMLRDLSKNRVNGKIINGKNTVYYVDDSIVLNRNEDYYVSVIPLGLEGIVVSMEGFFYPLEKEDIKFASTLGISNKIIKDRGIIKIHKGEALVIESTD